MAPAKAMAAAVKRVDANKNGIPDDEEFSEASADEPDAPNADAIAKKKAREAAQRRREEKADDDADDLSKDYKPKRKQFRARCRTGYSKDGHLGWFSTEIEAFHAYKVAKEAYVKELAEKWKEQIDPRVYEALMKYEVEITD